MVDRWKCKDNDGIIFLTIITYLLKSYYLPKKYLIFLANGKKGPNNGCLSVLIKVEFYKVIDWLFIEN